MAKKLIPNQLIEFKRLRSSADQVAYRLGMQRREYLNSEKRLLEDIVKLKRLQKEFGERVLKELRLDIIKDDYTFTADGEIKRLVAGKYEDID